MTPDIDREDITPPHGTPIPSASPQPANVREGPRHVSPDAGAMPEIPGDLWRNFQEVSRLFAVSPRPFNDLAYEPRVPLLRELDAELVEYLEREMRAAGLYRMVETLELILTIKDMLPHRRAHR
jgi:hypothetical protein